METAVARENERTLYSYIGHDATEDAATEVGQQPTRTPAWSERKGVGREDGQHADARLWQKSTYARKSQQTGQREPAGSLPPSQQQQTEEVEAVALKANRLLIPKV